MYHTLCLGVNHIKTEQVKCMGVQLFHLTKLKKIVIKKCVATANHNFKWVPITHICLISDQTFANLNVKHSFYLP